MPDFTSDAVTDGDEYIEIPDDTETDVDGEHPDGDYPQHIYNDSEYPDDDTEPATPEDEED